MRRKTPLPELLAPAGSPEALYAAVSSGADAVYLGGLHSARAFAKNFDEAELADAVTFAHLRGVRVYLALNTLLFDRELPEVLAYTDRVAALGIDAAIVADLGLIRLLRRHLPELPLHASTQAFIHNTATADHYASLGVSRVVAARELSREALREMIDCAAAEVEVFLHGALCVSHSGQCLFSSLVGGRSGNRGECAQPCRLPYGGGYPLSLSDLSLARHIPALIASGVSSLKIEGRMKSPSYVAGVTGIYRRLLDEGRAPTAAEEEELLRLFSRSGFTDRYYTGRHHEPMTGIRTAEDKAKSKKCEETFTKKDIPVTLRAELRAGAPARLTATAAGRCVTVTGKIPLPARSAPLTLADVTERLSKLGGTGFAPAEVTAAVDDGLFMTAASLNALRRAAIEALVPPPREPQGLTYAPPPRTETLLPRRIAVCRTAAQVRAARASHHFEVIYLALPEAVREGCFPEGVVLPPVVTDAEWPAVREMLSTAALGGARYAMCESCGQLAAVRAVGLTPVGGFRLNLTNRESVAALRAAGVRDLLLSPELSARRVRDLDGRIITYGRIPLMLTERCFVRETSGCRTCGRAALTDRRGVSFPLLREYPHRMLLLNSLPTYLADRPDLLAAAGDPPECYYFTNENEREAAAVLAAAIAGAPLPGAVRRLPQ